MSRPVYSSLSDKTMIVTVASADSFSELKIFDSALAESFRKTY